MAPLAGGNRLYLKPGFDVVHEARPTPLQSLKRKPIVFVLCACVCIHEYTHTHHHHARLLTRLRIASYELRLLGLFTFVQAHILMGQVDDRSLAEFSVCVPCTRALHTRRHYTQMVPIVAACYRLPRNQACCRKPHTHTCVCVCGVRLDENLFSPSVPQQRRATTTWLVGSWRAARTFDVLDVVDSRVQTRYV